MGRRNKMHQKFADIMTRRNFGIKGFGLQGGVIRERLEELAKGFDENIEKLIEDGENILRVADYDYRRKTSQYDPNEIYHVNETTLRISLGGRTAVPVMVYGVSSQIEKNMPIYEELIGDKLIQK